MVTGFETVGAIGFGKVLLSFVNDLRQTYALTRAFGQDFEIKQLELNHTLSHLKILLNVKLDHLSNRDEKLEQEIYDWLSVIHSYSQACYKIMEHYTELSLYRLTLPWSTLLNQV